jgi:nitrate/TMAO reductase-like tetraheme cytochrome c subunit
MKRKRKPDTTDQAKPVRGRKRRLLKRAAIGGVLMVVFMVASVEISSQSWFCNSCHIMNPFYSSWKSDPHSDVHCVECHIAPGVDSFIMAKLNGAGQVVDDVLNRTSTKPSASVSAMACLRSGCHAVERLVTQAPKNDTFKFSHEQHVDKEYYGLDIKCTTCHSHIEGSQHFQVNTSVCITCHLIESDRDPILQASHENNGESGVRIIRMVVRESDRRVSPAGVGGDSPAGVEGQSPAGDLPGAEGTGGFDATAALPPAHPAGGDGRPPSNCQACHEPPKEEFTYRGLRVNHDDFLAYGATCESCHRGVTSIPNVIDDSSCLSCHIFGVSRAQPTEVIHRVHAEGEHKIECFSCHGEPRHGPDAQTQRLEEFDCKRCHIDQHNIQRRTYLSANDGAGAEEYDANSAMVSPMFMAHVDCTGCHVVPGPLDSNPHSGAMVRRAAVEGCDGCHAPGLGARMIPLWQNATRGLYDKANSEFLTLDAQVTDGPARALLDEAGSLIEMVELDGSWGVHNPKYTQQLLEEARQRLAAAREAMNPRGDP